MVSQPNRNLLFTITISLILLAAALLLVSMSPGRARAVTCDVPSVSYSTIQSAVDDANCDTVNVASGVYTETVTIKRNVTVRGAGDEQTILDGENLRRPLTIGLSDAESIDTTLEIGRRVYVEDLAVRNGNATSAEPATPPVGSGRIGGGILVRNLAAAYLTNVRIYDSVARTTGAGSGFGGGIGIYGRSELHGENVRVYRNAASTNSGSGFGGGIASLDSALYMTGTYIYQNYAKNSIGGQGKGGGIYVDDFATGNLSNDPLAHVRLRESQIYSNTASNKGGAGLGGGLFAGETTDTRVWLYGNVWRGNIARGSEAGSGDGYGGAVAVDVLTQGAARLDVYGDEFRNNAANAVSGLTSTDHARGGAIYLDANSTGLLTATLESPYFASNYAESGTGSTSEQGGALWSRFVKVTWTGGKATGNRADRNNAAGQGGAVRINGAPFIANYAEFYDNVAAQGGAIYSRNDTGTQAGYLRMTNSIATDNEATDGAQVYFASSNFNEDSYLRHTTLADETGNPGQAVLSVNSKLEVRNSIIANHAVGIQAGSPQTNEDFNLFFGNASDTGGAAGSGGNSQTGDPEFVNAAARDYHIGATSAARNLGTDLGVTDDIDREPRDVQPDAGADEYTAATPTPTSSPTTTDTPTGTPTPTETQTPTPTPTTVPADTDIVINEVYYVGDETSDWIEIKNTGSGTYDISQWWLCSQITYGKVGDMTILAGDLNLGPGEIVVVRAWRNLDNVAADLGLYRDNNGGQPPFGDQAYMIDFLQWGTSSAIGRSAVAASKGIWREISQGVYDFVPAAGAGESAAFDGTNEGGGLLTYGTDYVNGTPSQGTENGVALETPTPTATSTSITPTTTTTSTPSPTPTPKTITVNVRNNAFEPAQVTIQVGDTVEWTRQEGFHNVRADDGLFRLGDVNGEVSDQWTAVAFTFTEPGTYPYYCEAHGAPNGIGMAGVVIVEAPPTPTPTSTPTPTATTGMSLEDVILNEIYYVGDANSDWIEIKNSGTGTVDVSNWWVSTEFDDEQIANLQILNGDAELGPGEMIVVRAWRDLNNTVADLGLYGDFNGGQPNFNDAAYLADFIQWGNGAAGAYSGVASNKGLWRETDPGNFDFAPAASAGQSTQFDGTNGGGGYLTFGSDFYNGTPSPGQENQAATSTPTTTPTATATTPSSGSTPTPTAMATLPVGQPEDIVLSEIYYTGSGSSDWIELKNTGSGVVDVSTWQLCARFSYKALSEMTILGEAVNAAHVGTASDDLILQPGEYLVLASWMDLDNTASDMAAYTSTDFGSPGALVDFVQWGTPDDVGRADVAAAKGIWPETATGKYDFVPTAATGQSLALRSSNRGTSAADFGNGSPTQGRENSSNSGTDEVYLPFVRR